jgi:hypothetical protein
VLDEHNAAAGDEVPIDGIGERRQLLELSAADRDAKELRRPGKIATNEHGVAVNARRRRGSQFEQSAKVDDVDVGYGSHERGLDMRY